MQIITNGIVLQSSWLAVLQFSFPRFFPEVNWRKIMQFLKLSRTGPPKFNIIPSLVWSPLPHQPVFYSRKKLMLWLTNIIVFHLRPRLQSSATSTSILAEKKCYGNQYNFFCLDALELYKMYRTKGHGVLDHRKIKTLTFTSLKCLS